MSNSEKAFWCLLVGHAILGFTSVTESYEAIVLLSNYRLPYHWLYFPFYASFILPDSIHLLLQSVLPYAMIPLILFGINNKTCILLVRLSFFLCYSLYYSWNIMPSLQLQAPWDCVLSELLFWAALVYPRPNKYGYNALKLIIFRVVFGFGKFHFLGAWSQFDYVRSLVIFVPFPTTLGLWLYDTMPDIFWYFTHLMTFLGEVIAPILLLFNGNILKDLYFQFSVFLILSLMFAIQVCGHFGWFNSIMFLTCWGVYVWNNRRNTNNDNKNDKNDTNSSNDSGNTKKRLFYYFYFLLSMQFVQSTTLTQYNYLFQTPFADIPVWSTVAQFAQTHRLLHGYGIFAPMTFPDERFVTHWSTSYCNNNTITNNNNNYDDCVWTKYQVVTFMDDDVINASSYEAMAYHPLVLAPWVFPRYEFIIGNFWESLNAADTPPAGIATLGINTWYKEGLAALLCQNESVTHVKREFLRMGYKNKQFYYKLEPTVRDIWTCSKNCVDCVNTPQSDKVIGIPEWDVRLPVILQSEKNRNEKNENFNNQKNIFVWNEDNMPYYELATGMGMVDCLGYLHMIPSSWHPKYCSKVYKLVLYLNECKVKDLTYDEIEPWAKELLGIKGEMFYNHDLLFEFSVQQIQYFASV